MPIPAFTYQPPAVTVIANGPLNTLQGSQATKTILMLGTAPQGPDYPTLCSASDALSLFGNPASYQSVGYDLPLAIRLASLQRQPGSTTGMQFLVCRAGVTRASVNVATSGADTNQVWTLTFNGTPTGNFTLTFGNQTTGNIAFSSTASTLASNIQTALQALSNVGSGNMTCAGSGSGPWTVTVTAAGTLGKLGLPAITPSFVTGGTITSAITTQGVSFSQVWQLTIGSAVTGGTYTLGYGTGVTSALAYNATAATIQSALQASTFIGSGNATVIPDPSVANSFWIVAAGSLADTAVATPLFVNGAGLTPTGAAGITLNTLVVGITAGTAFTLQGVGAYAGSKGNNLAVNVQGSGPSVSAVTIFDVSGTSPVIKQQFLASAYNLSSTQLIAQAINGANPLNNPNAIAQVSALNPSVSVQATSAGTPGATLLSNGQYVQRLSGGADGLGTQPTAAGDPAGTIGQLLANSLWTRADYIYAGFDAAQISPAIASHLASALAQNQFRKAILGPKAGTLFSSLSTTYTASFSSDRIVCIGHDALYAVSPVTGTTTVLDGFYAAAAFAGLKASGPTQETCTKFPIAGFTGVAIPIDLAASTGFLSQSQLNSLASAGCLVFEQTLADNLLRVRDAITTAPYAFTGGSGGVNGGINVFSQFSARDVDDAWSYAMVRALTPMLGRVFPSQSVLQQAFTLACTAEAARLGATIADYSVSVQLDPATNQPTVVGNYVMPFPALQITIPTAFTIA